MAARAGHERRRRAQAYYELVSDYGTNLCLNADPYSDPQALSAAPCNNGTNEQWILYANWAPTIPISA